MVDLAPFRGLRYGPGIDLSAVTAPPYDIIDEALAGRLRARSPLNVVRIELSKVGSEDPARYAEAGSTYRAWRRDGVLASDPEPSLYLYEQTVELGGSRHRQRGVMAALKLLPWESAEVLPHEHVFPGPLDDRLRLLEALPANVSPIYLVAEREPEAVDAAFDAVGAVDPVADVTDDQGIHHRVWRLTDPQLLEAISTDYRRTRLLLADGHHRYTTALRFRERAGDRLPGSDRILAFVAGTSEKAGPSIHPTHRLVSELPADALERMGAVGIAFESLGTDPTAALKQRGDTSFVLATRDGLWLARLDDPRELTPHRPPREPIVARLDSAIADDVLRAIGVAEGAVGYESATELALQQVEAGTAAAALLLRPVTVEQVWEVARSGARMPPKTTSFRPKPRTGLVIRPLDEG